LKHFDPRELRNAFGRFLTGVTVITTKDAQGNPRGFTANSFTSVSLEPPLLLVCIGKTAASCKTFESASHFAVNILSEKQKDISGIFASKDADKFDRVTWKDGPFNNPLLNDSVAWFECSQHEVVDAGDHIILIGQVQAFDHEEITALGYGHGGYFSPAIEQRVVNVSASSSELVVGAIVERHGEVLLLPDDTGDNLHLPHSGEGGHSGSLRNLTAQLADLGLRVSLGFLYAVYENDETGDQAIYYRGEAHEEDPSAGHYYPEHTLPWDKVSDAGEKNMLKRYFSELKRQRFSVYFSEKK
jgi:flavin reductase (DIM6/NTAB) family NADH-FMN oxidoreductase RutF